MGNSEMDKQNIKRTHDLDLYLGENRYENPKETSKILSKLVLQSGALAPGKRVSDVGCAAGEFIYHLKSVCSKAEYIGFDIVEELLTKARKVLPDVTFQHGSVLDSKLVKNNSFDLTFLLGVHSIFDEFETCLSNLINWTALSGKIILMGMFNDFPVDVWIKYRKVGDADSNHREPGWNIFSIDSFSNFLKNHPKVKNYKFSSYELPIELSPNPKDCMRSWTFRDDKGKQLTTNGLSILVNRKILEINL